MEDKDKPKCKVCGHIEDGHFHIDPETKEITHKTIPYWVQYSNDNDLRTWWGLKPIKSDIGLKCFKN